MKFKTSTFWIFGVIASITAYITLFQIPSEEWPKIIASANFASATVLIGLACSLKE